MTVRFSVLIPAYNAQDHLRRAIDSVLAQSLPAHQIIVVDDGSTDGTWEVIESYADRVVGHQQPNGGMSAARNAALDRATGDFVVLLDADDEWLPQRLAQSAAAIAAHPWADIVTTDALIVELDGSTHRYYEDKTFPAVERQAVEILRDNFIFVSAAIRRETLVAAGGFARDLMQDSEYQTWVTLILSGSRAVLCPESSALYHRTAASISSDRAGIHRMRLQVITAAQQSHALDDAQLAALAEASAELEALLVTHDALAAMYARDRSARRLLWSAARSGVMPSWKRPLATLAAVSPRATVAVLEALPERIRPQGS